MEIGAERGCNEHVVAYREEIIEMVKDIENKEFIEFFYQMLLSFKEKWGI